MNILGILGIIVTILKLLVILGVVATIHEIGHFTFAKLFKMKVNEFGIGFGKPILKKEYKGTKYSLRWIPLGGFVAIDGEDGVSEDKDAFFRKSTWKRIIVLLAGATFNAILALVIFLIVNIQTPTYTTTVNQISESSALYKAGIRVGDNITSVNGTKTKIYQNLALYKNTEKAPVVEYVRDGKTYSVKVEGAVYDIGLIGVYFKANKEGITTSEIDIVEGGSAAQSSDLRSGDIIKKIDGVETSLSSEVIKVTQANANTEIDITIEREGKTLQKKITPKSVTTINVSDFIPESAKTDIGYAFLKSGNMISQIAGSYVDLFKGNVKVTQLSGIVGIGEVVSKTSGFLDFINMLAIISLAIGLANVMPFPPLDGGKIVLVLVEVVTRKKVNEKVEIVLSYLGLGLLLLLTVFVTYNDIVRIF